MPAQLAAFPKCYLDALVVDRTMTIFDWIALAATLPHVAGTELYPPALESFEAPYLRRVKEALDAHGLQMPMMCASPDFTQPDPAARAAEIERQRQIIAVVAALGGGTCRVLSGQRRPEVGREEGIGWVVEAIEALLPTAEAHGVTLVMENHYKDGYWEYPEFAQASEVFLEIIGRIDSPFFGVNYDPSNAVVAGEDPIALLNAVKHRVVTLHASDRALEGGTLEDLRRYEAQGQLGYAPFLKHGVIGQGLIPYDQIFTILAEVGFAGWISLEDGQDPEVGMEHLRLSSIFVYEKMREYGLT